MNELAESINTGNQVFLKNYGERSLRLVRGEGSYVWDSNGKKYLDCVTGIAVNALGHCHPPVSEAIITQANALCHVSNLYLVESQIKLAQWLSEKTGYEKVFFCNSGAEANEALIKFVRKYWLQKGETSRKKILSFSSSFHGRTMGSLSLTGQKKLKESFEPLLEGFVEVPFNDVQALKKNCGEDTAAIFLEPIQAEGGVMTHSEEMLEAIAQCQKMGVLIIADEVQTGCGRTGEFLASDSWNFKPDALSLAKPLGGGLPLGGVLIKKELADPIQAGDHGTTFGGNPVACAAGLAVVSEVGDARFLLKVRENAQFMRQKLTESIESNAREDFELPLLGKGFLLGIRYKGNQMELIGKCRELGLLICKAGSDVIRFLPPLNITREQILAAVEIFGKAIGNPSDAKGHRG